MKKIIIFSTILTLLLAACTSSEPETVEDEAPAVETPAQKPAIKLTPTATTAPENGGSVSPIPQPASSVPPATELEPTPIPAKTLDRQGDVMVRALEKLNELANTNIDPGEVTNLQVESREWSDSSLGCPQEGMMYAQVLTSGYLVTIEAGDNIYEVHTDTKGNMILCTINGENAADVLSEK